MPQAKRRKDGTKRTHAEWAEKITLHGTRRIHYQMTGKYKFNEDKILKKSRLTLILLITNTMLMVSIKQQI